MDHKKYTVSIKKHTLQFKFDAGTSRGILKAKDVFYIIIRLADSSEILGLGEIAPLRGLSIDDRPDLGAVIEKVAAGVEDGLQVNQSIDELLDNIPMGFPSVRFGFEMALRDFLNGGKRVCFRNKFVTGDEGIAINGLIWMGSKENMLVQIEKKLNDGYRCLKLKIGAIDFDDECSLLAFIRREFGPQDVVLRVDANGAFSPTEALEKLKRLSDYRLHSIEQPIRAGNIEAMQALCEESPLPIALDEELIGVRRLEEKKRLLSTIQPHFMIVKPTLLGGFAQSDEWINLSESMGIGWWITSALESNVGLNAIAQYTASLSAKGFQGLGTGQLFHNNVASPLVIEKGYLHYDNNQKWNLNLLDQ